MHTSREDDACNVRPRPFVSFFGRNRTTTIARFPRPLPFLFYWSSSTHSLTHSFSHFSLFLSSLHPLARFTTFFSFSHFLFSFVVPLQLKEQLSQSHDKDSDLPTPLMFAAASSSLDAKSLSPLLTELLGCMCDIDEARRQRCVTVTTAVLLSLLSLLMLVVLLCSTR